MAFTEKSAALFEEAQKYIPGGVNSPVRSFQAVGGTPRFIKKAKEQYLYDEDGNKMMDFVGSWGPMILGNNHPCVLTAVREVIEDGLSFGAATARENEMAKLICDIIPSIEMVRMVNSGTEATMSALRAARGYTGRNKIIKFEGCYHGHSDGLLVKAGSGLLAEGGTPDSAGVTPNCAQDTLTARYNDFESVEKLFDAYKGEIAAVIMEPVAANMGVVVPEKDFMQKIRKICTEEGAVLIFDEVITGFRLSLGGAQELLGIEPDLTTFGKIIGGGMPVGAYGGKKEIMQVIAPLGAVYQAGTLSGNPVAMAAGIAQLTYLKENPQVYTKINQLGERLFGGLAEIVKKAGVPCQVNHIGSIGTVFFTGETVKNLETAKTSDLKRYGEYFSFMLEKGFYFAPAQFEAGFVSYAHTEENIDSVLEAAAEFFGV
ncbi:MAG: glutamate-1-semialdehyde 2,1-aminomutase [Anaerovoracaceae bacterium]